MNLIKQLSFIFVLLSLICCKSSPKSPAIISDDTADSAATAFPAALSEFTPYAGNPVFTGGGVGSWDENIRERGYILYDDSLYKMWYTGYKTGQEIKYLGYATSKDGIHWERYAGNPIFKSKWTEDMNVQKYEGVYYMFCEGEKDIAHLETSPDGIHWKDQGDLVIQKINGDTIPAPYGTPSVIIENGKWYLYYERNDAAIWLATSEDRIHWKHLSDEPVLKPGPEKYDAGAIAANQILKYGGKYYMYYHASANPDWASDTTNSPWSSNVAMSADHVHWTKYSKNPFVEGDHSSAITVYNGKEYLLYTMHPNVCLFLPKK